LCQDQSCWACRWTITDNHYRTSSSPETSHHTFITSHISIVTAQFYSNPHATVTALLLFLLLHVKFNQAGKASIAF